MTADLVTLNLTKDTAIVVWRVDNSEGMTGECVEGFANAIRKIAPDALLVIMPATDSMEVLDEEDMERYGWIRKPTL